MAPDEALKRVIFTLILPYVLIYAWWVGRRRKRS